MSADKKRIKPRLLKGFRDLPPSVMIARRQMIETIQRVYERFGFCPFDTPALEYLETLTGEYGVGGTKEIYDFEDRAGDHIALRYDLTVPLARYVAQHPDLPRPFRRYQVAPVWRFDKPGPGRFREFWQFDADTVGTARMLADAEIIIANVQCLQELGIENFYLRYSNRKLLNALISFAGIDQSRSHDVFRVLDKLDKAGLENVKLELGPGRVDKSGDPIPGLGLETDSIEKIEQFLSIAGSTRREILNTVTATLTETKGAEEAIDELSEIADLLDKSGVEERYARIDVSVARGLDYYTGPVFEAMLDDLPNFGSIFGGGRYDGLVRRFSGQDVPAVGASIGIDRLLAALIELGQVRSRPTTVAVLVTTMDKSQMDEYLKMTQELRQAGINTELFLGKPGQIGKQLQYADRQGIPLAIIAGSDEFSNGFVSVKNLYEGKELTDQAADRQSWLSARFGQESVRREDLVDFIGKVLTTD